MAKHYDDPDAVMKDFLALAPEYQRKAELYIEKLVQIQRAERHLTAKMHRFEKKRVKDIREGLCCSFCGKHQDDVEHLSAGPDVYICDECAKLCGRVLEEAESE